jgi:LAO/AO transport system kinase
VAVAVRARRRWTASEYADGLLRGDRFVLARAITLIESELARDQEVAAEVLERVLPATGQARRVGIMGVPGVGKSSFLEALGTHLTERGEKVAVLSIDPSSPASGGSILGDKTRMERLSVDPSAYIRPTPSRGELGGVGRRTRETILLCEAAGFGTIFVETVGVGQSETAVRSMTDTFLLLALAQAGDELQGIKRGIMEMVDIVTINKADLDPRGAEVARSQYQMALHFFPAGEDGWIPKVVTCSSREGWGIGALAGLIEEHYRTLRASGFLEERRRRQTRSWMRDLIRQGLEREFYGSEAVRNALPALELDLRGGRTTAFRAARDLLGLFGRKDVAQ